MKFLPLLLLLIPVLGFAEAAFENYSYLYAGKEIHAKVGEIKAVKVNDICLKDEKKCAALKIYHGPSKINSLKGTRQGNFAGAYCELLGGTQLFASKLKEEATQFCVFPDLTFIDAKALYREHSKRARAKK
ncbi:MAG: DUF333 domain-containing protein [Bdellovibrionota bacterium]